MIIPVTAYSGSSLYENKIIDAATKSVDHSSEGFRSLATNRVRSRLSLTPLRLRQPPTQSSLPELISLRWSGSNGTFTSLARSCEPHPTLRRSVLQTFRKRGSVG